MSSIVPLLSVENLSKYFSIGGWFPRRQKQYVRAVDGVSFKIWPDQTLGLVGESGCGKTTVGRLVARLYEPSAGQVKFQGQDITRLRSQALRSFRRNIQMVFQDPFTSLNPRLSAEDIIAEPLIINRWGTKIEIQKRSRELLEAVELSSEHAHRLPHEFSGGQRQRIAIARAIALAPKLVVCDEPVSALDMSIQAKILNLLNDLLKQFHLTYLFISHDLSVVRLVSDSVAVMYLGKIVEIGPSDDLFSKPLHPYTQALIAAIPDPHIRSGVTAIGGEIPSNIQPIQGCRFYSRCPARMPMCEKEMPALIDMKNQRGVACFLHHSIKEDAGPATQISASLSM